MLLIYIIVLSSIMWLYLGIFMNDVNVFLRILMVIVGAIALVILPTNRLFYPEMGEMVFPVNALTPSAPKDGNILFELTNLPPNNTVIYWVEKENTGISISNDKGVANILIKCDQDKHVDRFGIDKEIPKEIFFRYQIPDKVNMLSQIYSMEIKYD